MSRLQVQRKPRKMESLSIDSMHYGKGREFTGNNGLVWNGWCMVTKILDYFNKPHSRGEEKIKTYVLKANMGIRSKGRRGSSNSYIISTQTFLNQIETEWIWIGINHDLHTRPNFRGYEPTLNKVCVWRGSSTCGISNGWPRAPRPNGFLSFFFNGIGASSSQTSSLRLMLSFQQVDEIWRTF